MPDSKISGLSAVAAFAGTQEFAVNDSGTSRKISGAQLIAALPQGTLPGAYAEITATSAAFTVEADVAGLATSALTIAAGRRILVTFCGRLQSSVAGDRILIYIADASNNHLQTMDFIVPSTAAAQTVQGSLVYVPGAVTITYKIRAQRSAGTGTCTLFAAAGNPTYIHAEDVGV